MDIRKRMLNNARIQYENNIWAQEEQKKLLARERRERELADEKRRLKEKRNSELKQRVADTLKTESRPKPFGGSDYEKYEQELKQLELLLEKPIEQVKKQTIAEPEVPLYLKEPLQDSYLVSMLKANPTTTEWGKTSIADKGSNKSNNSLLSPAESIMYGAQTAQSVTDEALGNALRNLFGSIAEEGDPKHANFWGNILTGLGDYLASASSTALSTVPGGAVLNSYLGTYGKGIAKTRIKNWVRNAIGDAAIKKNQGEIEADANEINRQKELMARGVDMQRYTSNVQQIIEFYDQLDLLEKLPKNKSNSDLIQQVKSRIQLLEKDTEELRLVADDASTYYQNGDYNRAITSYEGSIGAPLSKQNRGTSMEMINNIIRANGYRGLSSEQKNAIKSYSNNIDKAVKDVQDEFDRERPDLLNRMADNIRELKSWTASEYNPSEEYTKIAESVTDFNFTDAKTYTHGMPGLIGSSMSFGGYQLASTVLGLIAMGAATVGTGGAAGAILAGTSLASTGLGIVGGHYENNTEGFGNYKEVFVDRLKKDGLYDLWMDEGAIALNKPNATEDEILYAMAAGIYEPKEKIKDTATNSLYGLQNLYKNDMLAVVGSEIFEAGINFMAPMVKMARASQAVPKDAARFGRMRQFLTEHPNAANIYRKASKIKDELLDSEFGAAVGGSISYPLGLVGRAVEAGVKSVVPKKMINSLQKAFSISSDIIERAPSTVLGTEAIGKNVLNYVSRVFGAGWSESIEEGKQYLNGKKFVDGSYSGASDTLMDAIVNDIAGGSRAAYSFVGDMFGATADRELIANMKGGFLGGFGHTATLQAFNTGYNINQDLRVNDFVINNVLANKLADRTTIQNNSYLAQQTSPMQYQRVMNAFNAMELIAQEAEEKNGGTDGLNFTADDIRNQRKAYQEVFNTANSKNVQDAAKQLDIKNGSKQYGNFVGLVMWAKDIANQGVKNLRDIESRANNLVNGLVSGVENDERGLPEILNGLTYIDLLELNKKFGIVEESQPNNPSMQLGTEVMDATRVRAMIPALTSYIKEIASLDALFTLRDQLEMLAEPTTADKRRLRSVKRQIKRLKDLSQFKAIKDAETADDFVQIPNQKLHDTLRDLYRDAANFTTDIEEGAAMQYMLLGGKVAGVDFLTSPELQQAYAAAQNDIKDRKNAALSLIDRYVNSVKSDEELRQAIHDTFQESLRSEEEVEDMEMEPEGGTETPSTPSSQPEPTVVPESPEESPEEPENGPEIHAPETLPPAAPTNADLDAMLGPVPSSPTAPVTPSPEQESVEEELTEDDYDEIIRQMEAEYAPFTNEDTTKPTAKPEPKRNTAPLTADEIKSSDAPKQQKTLAIAYLNGNHGQLLTAAYADIYEDIRGTSLVEPESNEPESKNGSEVGGTETLEQKRARLKQEILEKARALKEQQKKNVREYLGKLGMNTMIPSFIPRDKKQAKLFWEMVSTTAEYGYTYIQSGVTAFNEWKQKITEGVVDTMKEIFEWSLEQVDGYIDAVWNAEVEAEGETKTLSEWATQVQAKNEPEAREETEELDYDEIISQMEREYASSTSTMFTADDVNTDFGIPVEDWSKVSDQVKQRISNLMKRWNKFVFKWNGKPLNKHQWAGVNGWIIKFLREFDSLREDALLDIAKEDEKLSHPETNEAEPNDDQIFENLLSEYLFEEQVRDLFDEWVTELFMRWTHYVEAGTSTNMRLYSLALANVYRALQISELFHIGLNEGSLETYERVKYDIDLFNKLNDPGFDKQQKNVLPTIQTPSVRYERPWAQYTTTHTHMESSKGFLVEDSHAIDNPSIRFQDVSANPDFIQNGIFWFTTRPTNGSPKIQLNVMYNGHQFTPIDVHTADDASGKGRAFYRNVMSMLRAANGHKVMPQKSAISRSNGIIDDSPALQTFEQLGLLNDSNLYSIEYSSSLSTFCIVQYLKNANGQEVPVAFIPGQEGGRSKHSVYEYSQVRPNSTKPADGGIVMMVHPPYPEIDKDQVVPINVHYTPLTEGDAQLIIDLLSGKYMQENNGDYGAHAMENLIFTEDGISKGLTRMLVLRMLIRYKASGERYNPYQLTLRYIEYDRNDQRYVILHGNFGKGVTIPNNGRFNILDENDQKVLKLFLMEHHNKSFAYNEFLRCRINRNNSSFDHPLHGLTEFKESTMGKEVFKNGGLLSFGNSTIIFDEKDFGDAAHPDGVSGLAWAMRRGFVQSRFTGFTNTLINFNEDVPLMFDNQQLQQPQTPKKPTKTVSEILDDTVDISTDDQTVSLEDMDLMTGEKSKEKFSIEKANEFLEKVLGEKITDKNISERLSEIARTNASVLGLCHYSGVIMFDPYAPQGTEYHEAFHKLVELIVGDRTRKMLYKAYAKKMHIKYKDDEELLRNLDIREGLAEEFRLYMEERPSLSLGSLRHPFKAIKQVANIMGKIGDLRLYAFYVLSRKGVVKHLYKTNPEKVLRFLSTHGSFAPFSIGGHEFKNILNRYQYRVLRNTLIYLVFRTNDISILGDGIENFKISKQAILRDKNYQTLIHSNAHGAAALQELVENIEYVESDIKNYIYNTFEINRNDDDEAENEQDIEGGEGAMEASFNQLKYSHEVSLFSRTGAKVKFMLARIPKKRFAYKNGLRVLKNILNDEGLVEYFDVKYVFNTLVNYCHSCRNARELLNMLAKLGNDNAMFKYIHDEVISKLYENAQKGDADAEAAFAQLLVSLHAAKGEYVIGKASRDSDGTWNVKIQSTDSDYNAREYKNVWSQLFANGSEYLEKTTHGYLMKFRKGTERRYSPEVFHNIYLFFKDVKDAVLNASTVTVNYKGADGNVQKRQLDVTKEDEFDYVKEEFCNTLQKLGIQFNKDELNYTLATEFGTSDYTALSRLFERTDQNNFTPFLDWINGCYNQVTKTLNITQNGTLNGKNIETAIGSFGFVGMLANAKYKYTHDHDQLSVLATKGNRYYVISENSLITDITDDINAFNNGDTKMMDQLKSYSYNYMKPGSIPIGSLLMKQVELGSKLGVVTVAGFRTDQKGDMGQDYAEISPIEDYITKCQILMQGGLIFPTMSDKKTWTYLTGINIPGLSFVPRIIQLTETSRGMSQDRAVLEQMLQYAKCELQSIQECIKAVRGYTDEQGTKHPPLDESQKVLNYHKGAEYNGHTIIQGGRFSSLTGIYDDDGKFVSFNRIHEANSDKYVDEVQNWQTAQEYFFGIPDKNKPGMYYVKTKANDKKWASGKYLNEQQLKEHQYKLLTRILNKLVEQEMKYAANLGLIELVVFDEEVPVILRYKNKLLDGSQIKTLMSQYSDIKDSQQRESAAIAAYMTRISAASNISIQEVERIYSGHPAFFKWHYGENGELIDRSVDQHKRLGGLISTGQNNVLDIPGIPTKYVCAEVDNDLVASSLYDNIKVMMEDGELRSAYMRSVLERNNVSISNSDSDKARKLVKEIEALSIEEIKSRIQNENPKIYKILTKNATKKANDFMSDIDVADGAAYVTDEMAEWMLRMVGSWDSKIERAFKILRGEKVDGKVYTTKDILTLQQAYKDVLTTVIGNQKYTAYGFRFANGIATPYYDKMALFPMFKCLSTGPTAKIFDKMKKEGVHMLMINSAVKTGSQGSKDMNMSNFREDNDPANEANFNGDIANQDWKPSYEDSFTFNTYEQEFKYIRKQFNTDPNGKEIIKMGTQMTKVAMASMIAGRDYLIVEGIDEQGNKIYKTASAKDIRDDIMNSIDKMSDIGEKKVRERFIKQVADKDIDGNDIVRDEVNIEELSKFLKEELASRGASLEAIEAVSLTLDADGKKSMYVPPVAQSSLEWIQSIITSMINKNVIDINTPGGAFIQRSAWNMEGHTTVQSAEDLPSDIYEGRELLMVNEEGTMDCVVSIDFYNDIIPEDIVRDSEGHIVYETDDDGNFIYTTSKDENGNEIRNRVAKKQKKSFEAARQWLIDNNIISGRKSNGQWSNATANFIGSRIPTQAQSSIHALRCVDVLPVVRDTIVLPKEFTKITGADFDIDKLFLSRFYFKVYYDHGKEKVTMKFKDDSYEYYANKLISDYIALLKDCASKETENYNRTSHSNHASVDGDTKLLKDIIKDLEENKKKEDLIPYSMYSLWMNALTKTEFITGKFGIGPFALNNNSHILTMLYGVKFKPNGFLGLLGMNRLYISSDRYGNSILSWLSGLINAHADVAKDPYISRLNVNKYTYNLVNLMIRTGFGRDTFYFTTQPIMVEMAKAYNNAASQFGSESSRSKSRRQKEAVNEVVFDFVKRNFNIPDNVTSLKQADKLLDGYFKKVRGISTMSAMLALLALDNDVLHQISKNSIPMNGRSKLYDVGGVKMSAAEVQYLVYRAKLEFEPYEQLLSNLVKYSKIDTKKQGKNITEQIAYKQGVEDLFEPLDGKYGLFENLFDYYEHSYIKNKTNNALKLFTDIMGSFTIESTALFLVQVNKVLREIGEVNASADMRKAVARLIMNYIRAGFFNKWAEDNGIDIKGLVSGKNTISDRLEDIRIKIMTDPAYADMRASDGSIKNYLLSALVQGFQYEEKNPINQLNAGTKPATHNTAKFVKTLNFMDADHVNDDDMAEAWDELLNDPTHPDLLSFARDLIMYSYITSGGNSGNNLFKFIPNSWKLNSYGDNRTDRSYAQYMQNQLQLYQNSREELPLDINEIILNNWFDDKFVPSAKIDNFYGYYTGRYYYQGNSAPEMTIPIMLFTKNKDGIDNNDRYIKVRRNSFDPYTTRRYTVYRAIAETSDGSVIYVMVDPKGNKFPRDVIYEMRRNDSDTKESATVAAFSLSFLLMVKMIKGVGAKGNDLSQILLDFIEKLRKNNNIGNAIKVIDLATNDDTLRRVFEEAALINREEYEADSKIYYSSEFYERDKVAKDKLSLYIFTDNTDRNSGSGVIDDDSWYSLRYGTGHHYPTQTQAVIRGLDNARPISTQRWYHEGAKGETGRWTDDAFEEFKATIDAEIEDIKEAWRSGKYKRVVFPGGIDGFFNSKIANINPQRVPLIAQYLDLAIRMLEGFIMNEVVDSKQEAESSGARAYTPAKTSGENISSKGSDFAKRLTNPFNNETVEFRGTKFDNAEHAYLTWKSGKFDQRGYDAHGGKVKGTTDFSSNFQLMVDIITAKLQQHPDLVLGINERGGIQYIQNSTHNIVGDKYWESTGQNKFIEALLLAYKNVTSSQNDNILRTVNGTEVEDESWITPDNIYLPLNIPGFRVVSDSGIKMDFEFTGRLNPDQEWIFTIGPTISNNTGMEVIENGITDYLKIRLIDPDGTDVTEQYKVANTTAKPVATLTKEFVEQIKTHIKNDKFTVKHYEFSRIRESLVKLTDALFQYLLDNNVKVEFVEADPNNKAGGTSMIYPTEDGEGWRIEIDKKRKDVYLDILHELLHITTTPLDNPFSREFGIELPQQLNAYRLALNAKVGTMEGYNEAKQAEQDFLNHKITREEYEHKVPEKMRDLLHATESTGEFVSMFINSNDVLVTLGSIIYGERDLFSSIIEWFKDFLLMIFKGSSYVDIGNVLDDITDFLIKYKSDYLTPKLITGAFFGNNILESGQSSQQYIGYSHKRRNIEFIQPIIQHLKSIGVHVFGKDGLRQYLLSIGSDKVYLFIGNKRRSEFEKYLVKHRPDLSKSDIDALLDFLHSIQDTKENSVFIKTAIRWIANRSITLPLDNEKARQAFDLARKKNLDLQKYKTLGELISSKEMLPKEKKKFGFDPDDANTFSNKHTVTTPSGRVFTVYDVENSEEGLREVCKALAEHYEMSPWCLSTFTSTGEPTQSAKKFWHRYDAIQRKIAYENGKPVAFSSDTDVVDAEAIKGNLNGAEFIRVSKDIAYAWDEESITPEERAWLIKNELAYEENGLLYLTKNGISQADFGPNDPFENLNNPNREAWWDMEDKYPLETLNDNIVSKPQQNEPELLIADSDAEPVDFWTPDDDAQMEFQYHLQDEIRTIVAEHLDLIENRNESDDPILITTALSREYYDEMNFHIDGIHFGTNIYNAVLSVLRNNNAEQHIHDTINEYYHTRIQVTAPTPVAPSVFGEVEAENDLPFFKTEDGEIYGFVDTRGNIYIDDEVISPDHLMHEYTHIWDKAVLLRNKDLWNTGVRLMKKTSLWEEILNSHNYGRKWINAGYSGQVLEFLIGSEVHARLVGNKSDEIFTELSKSGKPSLISSLKQWFLNVYRFIANTFGYQTDDFLNNLTLDKFNSMTIGDFLKGTPLFRELIRDGGLTPSTFKDERSYDPNYKSSGAEYLNSAVRNYLANVAGYKKSISFSGYTLYAKNVSKDTIIRAIALTGGYVNDFSIKVSGNSITISPKNGDLLLIDTLAELRKTLNC